MPQPERRRAPRAETNLLVSYREDKSAPSSAGFVRALNLSETGMLLETPDRFNPGEVFAFRVLLDFDHVAEVEGKIAWFDRQDQGLNIAGIEFSNPSGAQKKIIRDQVAKYLD